MKTSISSNINRLLLLAAMILFTACQTIQTNGHFIDNEAINTIEKDKTTKEQVLDVAGSPEVVSISNPNKWYYVQRSVSSRLWFQPKVLEQKIVEIVFDNNDIVKKITCSNHFDNNNLNLNLTSDYTETRGNVMNPLQTYIKNMGRFNKKSKK